MSDVSGKVDQTASEQNPQFIIQRLYIAGVSLETPRSPEIFLKEWHPEVNLDLDTKSKKLDNDNREVILTLTVTVKIDNEVAFLVEVKQAGIFTLKNFPEDELEAVLASFCPTILYPYGREVVSDLVVRGGFPPLYLSPVNFDALYQQSKKQQGTADKKVH